MNFKDFSGKFFIILSVCLNFIICEVKYQDRENAAEPHRIAIIGGGIGGAATAYFLNELTAGTALLDVYESGRVGGRLATTPIQGQYYETGGTVLHPSNAYMEHFLQELGLSKSASCPSSAGLFDGSQFLFRDSEWQLLTLARLLWRYGWGAYKLHALNEDMLKKFSTIYSLQRGGAAYKDPLSLLRAMDASFPAMTQLSIRDYLTGRGISQQIVDELVMAVTLCNYGQDADIHAFVGSIAVAAATPGLWRVAGGNQQVPELLLTKARATVLHRHVTSIAATNSSHIVYQVSSAEGSVPSLYSEGERSSGAGSGRDTDDVRTQEYDAVIVAAPLTADKTDIEFVNSTKRLTFTGRFQRIAATFIQGKLRKETFKLSSSDSIDDILITNPKLVYNSVGEQRCVDCSECTEEQLPVHKVFSGKPLTPEQLLLLFSEINSTKVVDWRAYPHYESGQDPGLFELQPGLYHLNAIEWLGSAMEMSAIAAKNVALLAIKHLTGDEAAGNMVQRKDEL